MSEKGSYKDDR